MELSSRCQIRSGKVSGLVRSGCAVCCVSGGTGQLGAGTQRKTQPLRSNAGCASACDVGKKEEMTENQQESTTECGLWGKCDFRRERQAVCAPLGSIFDFKDTRFNSFFQLTAGKVPYLCHMSPVSLAKRRSWHNASLLVKNTKMFFFWFTHAPLCSYKDQDFFGILSLASLRAAESRVVFIQAYSHRVHPIFLRVHHNLAALL